MPRPGHSALIQPRTGALGLPVLQSGDVWFDATSYNASGGLVTSFIDRNDPTHLMAAANSARRVAVPTNDSALASQPSVTCATAQYLSNKPASYWTFTHNGTAAEWFFVFVTDSVTGERYLFDQAGTNGAVYQGDASAFRNFGLNTNYEITAAATYQAGQSLGRIWAEHGLTLGQGAYLNGTLQGSHFTLRRGATLLGDEYTWNAPGTQDAPGTMMFFDDGFGNYWIGRWACALFFRRILTNTERTTVRNYIQSAYGVSP